MQCLRFLSLVGVVALPLTLVGCASGTNGTRDAQVGIDGSIDSSMGDGDAGPPCAESAECDDGDPCDGVETCAGGRCIAGVATDCDDGVSCTDDTCDASDGSCRHDPDHTACATDLLCDVDEGCIPPAACTVDEDCDDNAFCNGVETCDAAFGCRPGAAPACDDGVACTADSCDPSGDAGAGACVHTNDSTACGDGRVCNGEETCDPSSATADGAGCVAGVAPDCDDGVACTIDGCDEGAGGCASTPDAASCSDGVFCNGDEVCDLIAGCGPGTPPACDDSIGCTTGRCDAATDACVQEADEAFCQDGMVCNGTEQCDVSGVTPGAGCVPGVPIDCSDGLACTTDMCAEPSGTCSHGGSDADGDGYTAVGCGSGDDCNDLSAAIHPGATELCDGIDNDCSGTADDVGGMECALGSGARTCTTSCGTAGSRSCTAACTLTSCVAAVETCNDCDDDGDGLIDDGLPCRRGTVSACTTSCGTSGARTCASDCSGYGACAAPSETCNDCDDDGDGVIDDGLPCRRGTSASCTTSCGTAGSRVCALDCSGYGSCRAAAESCNGCDDDANGLIDDGFACRQGATTACTTACGTTGVRSCASDCSGFGACVATEVCNGCDDDGDGSTDEGFTCAMGSSRGCTTGCGTSGTQTCNATCGGYGVCTAAEACNGCDDDGDGSADEDFACRQGATSGCTTSCGTAGVRTCGATCSGFGACSATEVCNGCDDDGVGGADNGFVCVQGSSRSCTTGCGTSGTQSCNGTCSAYSTCSATEVCNGCDDDGDGSTDEGFVCVQGATSACTTACGTAGSRTCNGSCSGYSTCAAPAEVCGNGCDDNANGSIDEGCGSSNDSCTGAIALSMAGFGTTVSGTTVGSTNQSGCGSGGDVYYSFTLTRREVVYLDTETASYDTEIALATSCSGNIACNDDSCFGVRSQLVQVLNPGTYYAVVSGFGGSTGTFTLRFQHLPTGNGTPIVLSRPATGGTVSGTTAGTGTLAQDCRTASGPEQMYYFTTCSYAGGSFSASTCTGTSYDTVLELRDATSGANTCNDDSCGLQSNISGTVSSGAGLRAVYVDGWGSTSAGSYTMTYTMP